jgi:5,10-methylenetetrahydrofolate reductase
MSQRDENPAGVHLPLDPLPGHSSRGRLERVLRRGEFAVTAELNPPDSADPQDVYDRAAPFEGWVDAINAVDASGANCHMASVGICALLTRMGYAPVLQVACRDRNRIAIQGDVLGAAAMGVANVLCLTGDGVQAGDQPGAMPVFDLDCMSLLETVRTMRDESRFLSGRKITSPPHMFIGAAENPFAPPYDFRPLGWPRRSPRRAVRADAILLRPAAFPPIPGTGARHRRGREVLHPGRRRAPRLGQDGEVDPFQRAWHPHPRRDHRASRGSAEQRQEGKRICIEIMQEIREMAGVSGVHVMAYRQEELVAEIVHDSGVLAGRQPWRRGRP